MAESIEIQASSRIDKYNELNPQMQGLLSGESNRVANMANFCAALKQTIDFHWVGFYLVEGDELVLGPFQGPVACTRLRRGKGVCAAAWEEKTTQIVPDVHAFPGHIACSEFSQSEIVVPVFNSNRQVWAVLDIDSDQKSDFSEMDQKHLEAMLKYLGE